MVADCEELMRKIRRLEKLLDSPYFARIDFCFEGEEEAEKVYIGRTSLMEKGALEIYRRLHTYYCLPETDFRSQHSILYK